MWVNGIKKKERFFILLGFFLSYGEKGQAEDRCTYGGLKVYLARFGVLKSSRVVTVKNLRIAPEDFPALW